MGKKSKVTVVKSSPTTSAKAATIASSPYTCTGSLRRQSNWQDIIIDSFSLSFYGKELITDSTLQLSSGRRYGLLGANGSGKSYYFLNNIFVFCYKQKLIYKFKIILGTLLNCLGNGEAPLPEYIDRFHLAAEVEGTDLTALDCVLKVDTQRLQLEEQANALSDQLATLDGVSTTFQFETAIIIKLFTFYSFFFVKQQEADALNSKLCEIYERLEALDAATANARASTILTGLGFDIAAQNKKTKDFSGGWRMRIALARALFICPTFLILDEPTNHLDMESCVWLEEYLRRWNPRGILLLVSHSQDFLNGVCNTIIHLSNKRLTYYGGNYDTVRILSFPFPFSPSSLLSFSLLASSDPPRPSFLSFSFPTRSSNLVFAKI